MACQVIAINLHGIKLPTYYHVSKAAHFRLFISDHLPTEVKKILYLDCDTIIDGPIDGLLDLDLSGHIIAATPDDNWPKHSKRFNLPQGVKYFNSGVLLINIKKWIIENVEYRNMEFIKNNYDKIIFPNQDPLNVILYNRQREISNQFSFFAL